MHVEHIELLNNFSGLLIQLDDRNKEIETLKTHIKQLELEKSSQNENGNNSLKPSSDSSGGTSPNSSSLAELGPDMSGQSDLDQVPEFDMSQLREFSVPEVSTKLLRRE